MQFEFLIPKRPLSVNAERRNLRKWKAYVHGEAQKAWDGPPIAGIDLHLSLVYLCDEHDPVDTDNIVKPIQDALIGLVYDDDQLVSDVESHRRPLTGTFDITRFPPLLLSGLTSGQECVFVSICTAKALEDYL